MGDHVGIPGVVLFDEINNVVVVHFDNSKDSSGVALFDNSQTTFKLNAFGGTQ